MLRKTEIPGLYKDSRSGAVINKDNSALQAYKSKKHRERKIDEITQDVDNMKHDISEIKQLLKALVEK